MLSLVLAGETIFFLPFVLARVFRPTLLEVFQINNFELGTFFSVYGIVALIAYLFGGPLADKIAAPKLMSVALLATALGGLLLYKVPDPIQMKLLYGYWGCTTILLFWAALMRATRKWGGVRQQGRAFGFLDGGRGITAALIGTVSVTVLANFLPEDSSSASLLEKTEAFKRVILFASAFVFIVGILIRFTLPTDTDINKSSTRALSLTEVKNVVKLPMVWMQAIIILCAYSGYKVSDDMSLLAKDLLDYGPVESARIGTLVLWIRPIAAIGAGFLADKISVVRMMMVSFSLMIIGGLLVGFGAAHAVAETLVFMAIVSSCLGMFAMRGLYFALMEEMKIPFAVTGTVVGFASIIGYTPDIYMGPLMGVLLDGSPGVRGHQHVFLLLTAFSSLGLIASIVIGKINSSTAPQAEP